MKTRLVTRAEVGGFLRKAQELIRGAALALEAGIWDSAAVGSIHATISALDAFCGHYLGRRSAESDHSPALDLAITAQVPDVRQRLRGASLVLSRKHIVEYEARALDRPDAEMMVKHAERLVTWIAQTIAGPPGS